MQRSDIGGRDITEYLMKLIMEKGYSNISETRYDQNKIVTDVKEKL